MTTRGELAPVFGPGPWLVVAPHDDDLVLGLGMTVAAAASQGIEVHVAVATDGSMGYMTLPEQPALSDTRKREMNEAVRVLGLDPAHVHFLGFADGSLLGSQGCRKPGEAPGLGQRLVSLLRSVRPTSVFVCTPKDLHPDHRAAASEAQMACLWAASRIWLELGAPIVEPLFHHYAVYCPFDAPPDVEVSGSSALLEQKLAALAAFASQGVIDAMVARIRADGPFEYVARVRDGAYRPRSYRGLFERPKIDQRAGEAFHEDLTLARDVLRDFPDEGAVWLERALGFADRPLLVVGEGSSQLFPGRFAAWLALRGGLGGRVACAGGREAADMRLDTLTLCFVSNSGQTRELIEVARSHGQGAVALLGTGGSDLARLVPQHLVVLPRAERALSATASVFAQALYLGQAVLSNAGYRPPLTRLAQEVERLLRLDLDRHLTLPLARVRRVFFSDAGHGLGAELALKVMELCGLSGVYAPGSLLLHGIEETLSEQDLLVCFDPAPEDAARRDAMQRSTGALLLSIGGSGTALDVADVGPLTPLAQLLLGYRLVSALALAQGRDPDRPRRTRSAASTPG